MRIEICGGLSSVDAQAWDHLVGSESPFLEWGWLAALEDSGCVSRQTGWLPQHLTVWEGKHLIGACPLYVKGHSAGEFIFDPGWADAAQRVGLRYYPKLLAAVPFTPASGRRFLTHPSADRPTLLKLMAASLVDLCRQNRFSSVHVNFCAADEIVALAAAGFRQRSGYQFQWINDSWQSFDDYLAAFRSKRRVQIRREQRELETQAIDIRAQAGDEISDDLFAPMFRLYKSTVDKHYWGQQYLNPAFFDLLRQRWKSRLVFFVARQRGEVVAGTFTVRKGDVLYGRYWGAFAELRHLHFNVCYYASIQYCLSQGITRFEPGAGGEFKYLRGFDPRPTYSMHFIADPQFDAAVADFLKREERVVVREIETMEEQSPIRRTHG